MADGTKIGNGALVENQMFSTYALGEGPGRFPLFHGVAGSKDPDANAAVTAERCAAEGVPPGNWAGACSDSEASAQIENNIVTEKCAYCQGGVEHNPMHCKEMYHADSLIAQAFTMAVEGKQPRDGHDGDTTR